VEFFMLRARDRPIPEVRFDAAANGRAGHFLSVNVKQSQSLSPAHVLAAVFLNQSAKV
jgi:hypothetical protein